jgi:hypothetical protein
MPGRKIDDYKILKVSIENYEVLTENKKYPDKYFPVLQVDSISIVCPVLWPVLGVFGLMRLFISFL